MVVDQTGVSQVARLHSTSIDEVNPYIAFTDLMINFVLILVFFLAALTLLGRIGWDEVRYRDVQREVRERIESELSGVVLHDHPLRFGTPVPLSKFRNDPPGAQRWVIYSEQLFVPGTSRLTSEGMTKLKKLATVLIRHHEQAKRLFPEVTGHEKEWLKHTWRRIRVEGHTRPTQKNEPENWRLSAERAAVVANYLAASGVPAWHIAVAARGGQTPFAKELPITDPRHERVEIVLEYAVPREARHLETVPSTD